MKNKCKRRAGVWLYAFLISLFFAALGLSALAARFPGAVERFYSRGLYPLLAVPLATISRLTGFSLAQFLIPAAALALVVLFALECARAVRRKEPVRFLRAGATVLAVLSCVYFAFVAMWALNYNRQPLSHTLGYGEETPTAEDMVSLFEKLTDEINTLANEVDFGEDGSSYYRKGKNALLDAVWSGYENLKNVNPDLYRVRGRIKQVVGSRYMGYTGISGVYICFTGEPNVNGALPHFALAFTAAHEAAHLQGFAREDEANFIAYLALRESDDPYLRYCGAASMYRYLAGDVAATDPQGYQRIAPLLCRRVAGEFAAYSAFLKQYESPVQQVAQKVNNAYLESQGQQGGTLTYGYVTRLLVADYVHGKNG